MKPKRQQSINYPAVLAFIVIVVFWACIGLGILSLFGCSTQKEMHEHHTHTVVADTMATEARHDGHRTQTVRDLDSLVTASLWAAMQEFASSQTERETTTETLTETIDSLGRIIRQQQKTTDRTLSRQEQLRQQQQQQEMEVRIYETLRQNDSAWNVRITAMEAHLRDSLSAQIDKQTMVNAAEGATWWQKSWAWLKGILIGLAIGIIIMLTRKYWSKWRISISK